MSLLVTGVTAPSGCVILKYLFGYSIKVALKRPELSSRRVVSSQRDLVKALFKGVSLCQVLAIQASHRQSLFSRMSKPLRRGCIEIYCRPVGEIFNKKNKTSPIYPCLNRQKGRFINGITPEGKGGGVTQKVIVLIFKALMW